MRSRDLFVAFLRAVGLCLLCAALVLAVGLFGSPTADATLVSLVLLVGTTALMGVWMLLGATTVTNRLLWPDEAPGRTTERAASASASAAATSAAAGATPGTADEASSGGDEGPPGWILRGVEYFMAWAFTLRAVDAGAEVVARLLARSDAPQDLASALRGPVGSAVASAILAAVLFFRASRGARSAT